jgi:hypothetical protein
MRNMWKKGIPPLLLVSLLCLVASCAGGDSAGTNDGAGPAASETDRLDEELSRSSEVAELVAIRDELAARAVERGVTPDEIRGAATDVDRSNALLGLTPDEARARFDRIDALVGTLFARYPALADIAARDGWRYPACDAEGVALAWEHYSRVLPSVLDGGGPRAFGAPARPPLICKMTQFIIGISLCALKSAGSATFYFICSYGVFCGSCDGGIADLICP